MIVEEQRSGKSHLAHISHLEYMNQQTQPLCQFPSLFQPNLKFIVQMLKTTKNITISHLTLQSEVLTIAECLSEHFPIVVVSLAENIRKMQDKLSKKEIKLKSLTELQESEDLSDYIVIWDLFNLHRFSYEPYFVHSEEKRKNQNIVYCHKSQQQEIETFYESLTLNIEQNYPFQIVNDNIEDSFVKFIEEEQSQLAKQDIVIFHLSDENYLDHISQILRRKGLLTHVRFITHEGDELAPPHVANIFLCKNVDELLSWNYPLNNVYFVFDYGEDQAFYFDFSLFSYVSHKGRASKKEINRRMTIAGCDRLGQYCYDRKNLPQNEEQVSENHKIVDIGRYCLTMMKFGFYNKLEKENKDVKACLEALQKAEIINSQNTIVNQEIYLLLKSDIVNPVYLKSVLKNKNNKKLANLLIMSMGIFLVPENLRKVYQDDENIKEAPRPTGIWRKSGYLESCLDLFVKYKILEERRERLKKQKSDQYDKLPKMAELEEQFCFSHKVMEQIDHKIGQLQTILEIPPIDFEEDITEQDFEDVLISFATHAKLALTFFSGSRRLGYFFKAGVTTQSYLPDKESLMFLLNERPDRLFRFQMNKNGPKYTISKCNYISQEVTLTAYGSLPFLSKQSFGEAELQFMNISSATFNHLTKFNSFQIENFENEYQCSIESNEEMGIITIQCSKEKQSLIRNKFENILSGIKDMFHNQTKIIKYSKTMNILLGAGGQIEQLKVKQKEDQEQFVYDTAIITNLSSEVQVEDLKELFDEFFQVKDMEVVSKKDCNEAIVYFSSHKDYKKLYNYFNGCMLLGKNMLVQPFLDKKNVIKQDNYLLFEWNDWKSSGEALAEFSIEKEAILAEKQLRQITTIEESPILVQRKGKKVYITGLNPTTDERFLEGCLGGYGRISYVEMRRHQAMKKNQSQSQYPLDQVITQAFFGEKLKFKSEPTVKGKNGYRSAKVRFELQKQMKEVYFVLNDIVGNLGTSRLYATPCFTYPLEIPVAEKNHVQVYLDIISGISEELNRPKPFFVEVVKEINSLYLVIRSNEEAEIDILKNMLFERLKAEELKLEVDDQTILLSDFGMQNIVQLEKEYICKFSADFINKKLKVLCKPNIKYLIQKQINSRLIRNCIYKINLHIKAFKYLKTHKQKYSDIQKDLAYIGFEDITGNLILQGQLHQIQKAKNYFTLLISNIGKGEEIEESDVDQLCLICYSPALNAFKLENCGHKFCYQCLLGGIRTALKDINLYPLKCPSCLEKIFICDLFVILNEKDWKEIINTSVNCFVFRNPEKYIFCFTARCPQINIIEQTSWFRCRQCKKGYCMKCKTQYHPGMSCSQARYGSDRLLEDYMLKNGGRTCANRKCRAPIVRISGCFKVQCAKCRKCMCFKCSPQAMVPYDTPAETYDHMDKAHGGCF